MLLCSVVWGRFIGTRHVMKKEAVDIAEVEGGWRSTSPPGWGASLGCGGIERTGWKGPIRRFSVGNSSGFLVIWFFRRGCGRIGLLFPAGHVIQDVVAHGFTFWNIQVMAMGVQFVQGFLVVFVAIFHLING